MNMSYCRFQNTLRDLQDCESHLFDTLSPEEHEARLEMIEICRAMAEESDGIELEVEGGKE
jgi:hypothetical protein